MAAMAKAEAVTWEMSRMQELLDGDASVVRSDVVEKGKRKARCERKE